MKNDTPDDRAEFACGSLRKSIALGRDEGVFNAASAALTAADAYDYSYLWSWWGLPIIQLPADIMATQEVVFAAQPTVIVETGVARGGSVVFLASLLQLLGRGKVIGVDIDIRRHNRESIERHPIAHRIHMVEGSSVEAPVVALVRDLISPEDRVMVILDSDHSRAHVLQELRHFGPIVTSGQYMIVADTLLGRVAPPDTLTKRSKIWHPDDEQLSAVKDYLAESDLFEVDEALNGKLIFASSPGGYLKRRG